MGTSHDWEWAKAWKEGSDEAGKECMALSSFALTQNQIMGWSEFGKSVLKGPIVGCCWKVVDPVRGGAY